MDERTGRRDFQRTVHEWEHNRIGLSDKVIPPFTPLEVEGNRVRYAPAADLW